MDAGSLPAVRLAGAPARAVPGLMALAGLASIGPLLAWVTALVSPAPVFNDFNSYWLAGRLVDRGLSPYDLDALAALGRAEGRVFLLGGGYSYPLPFALLMAPLSRLPFDAALSVFLAISIAAFGLTVAAWLRWAAGWLGERSPDPTRLGLAALVAGCCPPVAGTIQTGQANLLVLALLAPGVRWLLDERDGRRLAGAVLAGGAAVVKIVPAVIGVPLLLARRGAEAGTLVAAAVGLIGLASLIAPAAGAGMERLAGLLDPDPYFTNVSINGFVTRFVEPTDRSAAVLAGAYDPRVAMPAVTVLFAAATLAVLWAARHRLRGRRDLALAIAFALVAGIIGGPKNSFWNVSLALVSLGLLLAAESSWLAGGAFLRGIDRLDRVLLLALLIGVGVQTLVWVVPPLPPTVPVAPLITLAGSGALYGLLCLWVLLARRLLRTEAGS